MRMRYLAQRAMKKKVQASIDVSKLLRACWGGVLAYRVGILLVATRSTTATSALVLQMYARAVQVQPSFRRMAMMYDEACGLARRYCSACIRGCFCHTSSGVTKGRIQSRATGGRIPSAVCMLASL